MPLPQCLSSLKRWCLLLVVILSMWSHTTLSLADQHLQFHLTDIPLGKEGSAENLFVSITGLGLEDLLKPRGAIQSLELRLDNILLPPVAIYRASIKNIASAGPMSIVPSALQRQVLQCLTPCQLETEFLWTPTTVESILNSATVKTMMQKALTQSTWGKTLLKPTRTEVSFNQEAIHITQHTETGWFHLAGPQLKATLLPQFTSQGLQLKGSSWRVHPGGSLPIDVQNALGNAIVKEANQHLERLQSLLETQGLRHKHPAWQLTWSQTPSRMLKVSQQWEVQDSFQLVPPILIEK
ncbi:MAG: hypothetical protein ACKO37_00195 [Vampirovibrionales bacterium]